MIEASGTDLSVRDVLESEVFPLEDFGEFRIRLIDGSGDSIEMDNVTDFAEWMRTHSV